MLSLHEKSALFSHRRLFRGGFCENSKTPVGEPISPRKSFRTSIKRNVCDSFRSFLFGQKRTATHVVVGLISMESDIFPPAFFPKVRRSSIKNLRFSPIGGCSAVAFACAQKHLSGSRLHHEKTFTGDQPARLLSSFGIFSCQTRKVHFIWNRRHL